MADIGYLILEWNQASDQPAVAIDAIYDDADEAREQAAAMQATMAKVGRRERFTVHEIDPDEAVGSRA